jgi:hypothetical protein
VNKGGILPSEFLMNPIVKNPHFYFNPFLETKIILNIQPLALPPAPITRKKNNFFLLPHFEKKSAHEGGKIFFFFFFL